jgi:TetR/AcrR family transcriptional repressor of nem operon
MGRKPDPTIREDILRRAECLIHLRGYASTTMDEIAARCRMTKANLFHHFGSKEELGLAVLDWKIADYQARSIEPLCAKGDPALAVEELFEGAAKLYEGNGCKAGCFVANIASEMADASEKFRSKASQFFSAWTDSMSGCLERAKACGMFDSSFAPRVAAESIIALYEGAILLARTSRDAQVFRRLSPIAVSILSRHKHHTRRIKTMGPKTPCGC